MKVLVLGNGAREHALAWKISQSPEVSGVYLHPGNGGTDNYPRLPISSMSPESVAEAAQKQSIRLIVIGPEALLADGYADFLRQKNFLVVGPNADEARLETSKFYAKQFMVRANVPTARFVTANSAEMLEAFSLEIFPLVLKLDGLAAGKGVVIAVSRQDILDFSNRVYRTDEFGEGPHTVLIEDFIRGRELSYIGFCDGTTFLPLPSATDYKRIGEGNTGPNTGGMGAISPSPYLTQRLQQRIDRDVIHPILEQMQKEKMQYRGILYVGLMITEKEEPYVLEFNARFGDPETQATLLRLDSDILPLLLATATGKLELCPKPSWSNSRSIYVVASAKGYPNTSQKGDEIRLTLPDEAQIFFAGAARKGDKLLTSGGRVLGVGATGKTLEIAKQRAYKAFSQISWDGIYFRRDIGQ